MLIKRKFRYLFVAASLLLFIPPVMAEDTPWEKFNLVLGYFIANTDTGVRLGSGLGVSSYCQELCMEKLGGDPILFNSIDKIYSSNYFC